MWIYYQANGELWSTKSTVNKPVAVGYSGLGTGKNNPDLQCTGDIGPIPRGRYKILNPQDQPTAFSFPLQPAPENNMCGRDNFLIHGDNTKHPGWASQGCIVIGDRTIRELIAKSGDKDLEIRRAP